MSDQCMKTATIRDPLGGPDIGLTCLLDKRHALGNPGLWADHYDASHHEWWDSETGELRTVEHDNYWTNNAGRAIHSLRTTDGADGAVASRADTAGQYYDVKFTHTFNERADEDALIVRMGAETFKSMIESSLSTLLADKDVSGDLRKSLQGIGMLAQLILRGRAPEALAALTALSDPEDRKLFTDLFGGETKALEGA